MAPGLTPAGAAPLDAWERARAAYDRFIDLRTARSGTVGKREREAFIAAMLGVELDANGYAVDPQLP